MNILSIAIFIPLILMITSSLVAKYLHEKILESIETKSISSAFVKGYAGLALTNIVITSLFVFPVAHQSAGIMEGFGAAIGLFFFVVLPFALASLIEAIVTGIFLKRHGKSVLFYSVITFIICLTAISILIFLPSFAGL